MLSRESGFFKRGKWEICAVELDEVWEECEVVILKSFRCLI